MAKLTNSQLIVLSAAARDDGLAVAPAKINKAAAAKVGSSHVARKLMWEVKATPVWRQDGRAPAIGRRQMVPGRLSAGMPLALQSDVRPRVPRRSVRL
jgi:hypothetical protein